MKARGGWAGVAALIFAASGGLGWARPHARPAHHARAASHVRPASNAGPASVRPEEILPLPPLPLRIAGGADYERCLDMLNGDAEGASAFAEAWEATGGGDGATHCAALAEIGLGDPAAGATQMERLASDSQGPAAVRASLFGQAGQAWLLAGQPDRAYGAETMALTLAPDDADLLVSRAVAAAGLGRFRDAMEDLTRVLAFDPRRVDALVYRAAAWRAVGRLERARGDVERAFALGGGSPEAHLERGMLRQLRGDLAGARGDWEAAVAMAPGTATAELAEAKLGVLGGGVAGQ